MKDEDKDEAETKGKAKSKEKEAKNGDGDDDKVNESTDDKKKGAKKEEPSDEGDGNENDAGGVALGEIAKIEKYITATRIDSLQPLHQICFDAAGKTNLLKKSLRQFAGFDFDKESDEFAKKVEAAQKFDLAKLKGVCEGLQLDKKGSKETICQRICEFLISPNGAEDDAEEENNSEQEEPESEEQESEEEKPPKSKRGKPGAAARNAREEKTKAGRPRRSTAGRAKPELSSYVEYSSSEEDEPYPKKQAVKRKRGDDSDSGSDVSCTPRPLLVCLP